MRVLVVVTSSDRRGAEIEGSQFATELTARGHEADAVALVSGADPHGLDLPTLGTRPKTLSTLSALRRRARDHDVVIAWGSTTLPACAIALAGTSVPFVYRSIGDPADWVSGRVQQYRTGRLLRRAARVVALWPDAAESMSAIYSVRPEHLASIPNARSMQRFRAATPSERQAARTEFGLPSGALVVGCIGALSPEKQIERAIDAAASLADAHLLVVGDGSERTFLGDHGRRVLGDRITLTGSLDDVTSAFRALDVLLMTSRTEGLPGVILEAAACRIPVVATDVGGIAWLRSMGLPVDIVAADAPPGAIGGAIRIASARPLGPVDLSAFGWPAVCDRWLTLLSTVG